MRTQFKGFQLLLAALALAGCETTRPTEESGNNQNESRPSVLLATVDPNSTDGEFLLLDRSAPGFGGMHFQGPNELVVHLTDMAQAAKARQGIDGFFLRRERKALKASIRFVKSKYAFHQLKMWQVQATPLLAKAGFLYTDVDESANRVRIGVASSVTTASVATELARLGVPPEAVEVSVAEPPQFAYTLSDRVRPTMGGLVLTALHSRKICTLGFHVRTASGVQSFLTNSHCTDVQGGTEGTRFYQPGISKIGTELGTETSDPLYFTGGYCPVGRRCRFSDAALSKVQGTGASFSTQVARTTVEGTTSPGSTVVAERLPVVADQGAPLLGTTAWKTGWRSGTTRGIVNATCMDAAVAGTNVTLLCQYRTNAASLDGDSGSPVYRWYGAGTGATLEGMLWGRTSIDYFFSSMNEITSEIGAFTTH